MTDQVNPAVEKLPTGITTFDIIAKGGLPKNRTTLVSGTAGSGKTVLPLPAVPDTRVVRFFGRPPLAMMSKVVIPVGSFSTAGFV